MELRGSLSRFQPHRARAQRRSRRRTRKSSVAARAELAHDGRLLVRRHESGRDCGNDDAALPRDGVAKHHRKGANSTRAVRLAPRGRLARGHRRTCGFSNAVLQHGRFGRAHANQSGGLRKRRYRRGRRRDHRIHLRNHRKAESGNALSSRRHGDVRYVRPARAAAASRRSFCGQPAAGIHFRVGRIAALSAARGCGDAAARESGAGGAAEGNPRLRRERDIHGTRCVSRNGRHAFGIRRLVVAKVRVRRRNASAGDVANVVRTHGTQDFGRDRQHRDAAHFHRLAGGRGGRRCDRTRRTGLRRSDPRRKRHAVTAKYRRPSGGKGADRLSIFGRRASGHVRSKWLELSGRCVPPRRKRLLLVRRTNRRHDYRLGVQHFRPRGRASAAHPPRSEGMRRGR